ncbi:outer membrane lipoprotein-sorting protein [Pleionea sediminis]|uniref:outer membrane lipoprotein-sorting protein n=1 Tax=Pleionea sediminis TaxID=2569479 RepID=UPI001185D87C|nr:outer membrane lipoprotein-sorting protein [Pleionea sediminis]
MKKNSRKIFLSILVLVSFSLRADDINYLEILDSVRGYQDSGFKFDIVNVSVEPDGDKKQNQLRVKVLNDKSLVEFISPERVKGRALLKEGKDMWLHIPNTRRVIRVAPAQRLLGQTSNADVVGVSYSKNYKVEQVDVNENSSITVNLVAEDKSAIYHKIVFVLAAETPHLPVQSEHYSRSGKLIKVAHYKEYKKFDGQQKLHKLLLVDPIREGYHTWMLFDNYQKQTLSVQQFAKDELSRL